MQNSETTAILKKGNVFGINDVLHDFQTNFLNEVACREWIFKKIAIRPGILSGGSVKNFFTAPGGNFF